MPDSVRLGILSRREHRCRPGHHRPGCGGSTPPSCRVRVANFYSEVPALNRRERGAIPRQPTNFNAPVAQSPERDASNVGDEGESPSGSANFLGMWFNPNSRGSRLRIWQSWGCKSLHAHHFTATGFSGNSRPRRLKIAEPSGCKSRVADRRVVNREQQTGSTQDRTALGVQVSPRRPIGNVNRTSGPGLFAKQCAPGNGSVVQVHGIPPFFAISPGRVFLLAWISTEQNSPKVWAV